MQGCKEELALTELLEVMYLPTPGSIGSLNPYPSGGLGNGQAFGHISNSGDSHRHYAVPLVYTQSSYLYRVPQCMSPRGNWDSPTPSLASECAPPPRTKGGRHTRLRVRGWGSSNSDDWRKSLALCLLWGFNPQMTWSNGCRASFSRSHTKKTCRSWPLLKFLHICFLRSYNYRLYIKKELFAYSYENKWKSTVQYSVKLCSHCDITRL
jgi:hypothetical protein